MKKTFFLFSIFSLLFLNYACKNKGSDGEVTKKASSGKTLEVLIAANSDVYKAAVKALVDSLFEQPQTALNQYEPMFDIVNMPKASLYNTEMFKTHRNIVIIDKSGSNPNKVYLHNNPWAYPQVVVEFAVTNNEYFLELFPKYFDAIVEKMHNAERIRVAKAYKKMEDLGITKKERENFGFWLIFSNEFRIATLEKEFAWIRKEAKDFSIGILMYTMPYSGDTSLLGQEKIIALRDSVTHKYIPGPTAGSYMTSEKRVHFFSKNIQINHLNGIETRGLWRVENDFMGGPFVNYLLLDAKNNRLIMLDGYIYSPRKPKRDLLMQAEGIIYTLQLL